jgi:DNA polymerase delta subunit 1
MFRTTKIEMKDMGSVKFQIVDWRYIDKNKNDDEYDNEEDKDDKDIRFEMQAFGVTKEGYSVGLNIIDFCPFFYIKIDDNWGVREMKKLINKLKYKISKQCKNDLIDYTIIHRKDLYGFSASRLFKFIKLTFKNYTAMKKYSYLFNNEYNIKGGKKILKLYEANLEPMLRYFHIKNIKPTGWIKVKKYKVTNNLTACQINIETTWDNVISMKKESIAPLLIASFDIECMSAKGDGSFPDAKNKKDKVIQIGTTIHKYGDKSCIIKHITTLKKCNEIDGVIVESYKTEKEVLLSWSKFIQKMDPDILTGYNIWGFDENYIYERAKLTGCLNKFMRMGRMVDIDDTFELKKLSSSAMGDNFLKYIDIRGRVQIDLLKLIQREYKLDSYKLDNVAKHFLNGKQKLDFKPKQIFENFLDGRPKYITEIAEYCVMDCILCNDLIIKLDILPNNIGMSNVCSIPLQYIFSRGQSIKGHSLVAKYCRDMNTLIPVVKKKWKNEDDPDDSDEDEDGYEGAVVLEPNKGLYFEPIIVVDYASLYPSTMISENISHDTMVDVDENGNYKKHIDYNYNEIEYDIFKGKKKEKHKIGVKKCVFAAKKDGTKGIIPNIAIALLKARKDTRKKIKYKTFTMQNSIVITGLIVNKTKNEYTVEENKNNEIVIIKNIEIEKIEDTYDIFQKSILDGLQLAYKVTANSIYGLMGASVSPIYCKELAASTTSGGRKLLHFAKNEIETNFEHSKCIYGDTDSCFISVKKHIENTYDIKLTKKTETEFLKKVWEVGVLMGRFVSKQLKKPHDLEMEKILYPYILFAKKRYASNKYDNPTDLTKFKLDYMGILLKRRDNCPIAKDIYSGIMNIILNEKDIDKALVFYKNSVKKLLFGNIPIEKLIITKKLSAEYKDPTSIAHKVLAQKMTDRDSGNAPVSNDRIPFVYIDINELKCDMKGCCNKINQKNGKCIYCMDIYCVQHVSPKTHECFRRCRMCFVRDDSFKNCGVCDGVYCPLHIKFGCHKFNKSNGKCTKKTTKLLQGDLLESPTYVKEIGIKLDFKYYYEHQLMKPINQIFELDNSINVKTMLNDILRKYDNIKNNNQDITKWFSLKK